MKKIKQKTIEMNETVIKALNNKILEQIFRTKLDGNGFCKTEQA